MKTMLLILGLFGGCLVARAAETSEDIALPEMRVTDSWGQVTSHVPPQYPWEMRRAGQTGRVSLDLAIDARGRVRAITVLASDNPVLADSAREAVRQWRFVPAGPDTTPARRHARITFSFELIDRA